MTRLLQSISTTAPQILSSRLSDSCSTTSSVQVRFATDWPCPLITNWCHWPFFHFSSPRSFSQWSWVVDFSCLWSLVNIFRSSKVPVTCFRYLETFRELNLALYLQHRDRSTLTTAGAMLVPKLARPLHLWSLAQIVWSSYWPLLAVFKHCKVLYLFPSTRFAFLTLVLSIHIFRPRTSPSLEEVYCWRFQGVWLGLWGLWSSAGSNSYCCCWSLSYCSYLLARYHLKKRHRCTFETRSDTLGIRSEEYHPYKCVGQSLLYFWSFHNWSFQSFLLSATRASQTIVQSLSFSLLRLVSKVMKVLKNKERLKK